MVISVRGSVEPTTIVRPEGLCQMKYSSNTIKNRTHDLPTSSAVPHPTASQRVPHNEVSNEFYFSWYRKKMWCIIHLKPKLFWDSWKTVQYQDKNCRCISYCRPTEGLNRRIFINLLSPSGRLGYSRWVQMHLKKFYQQQRSRDSLTQRWYQSSKKKRRHDQENIIWISIAVNLQCL